MPARPSSHAGRVRCVLAVALAGALLAGCGPTRPAGQAGPGGELPDQLVEDFVLTETDEGHPQFTVYARSAATYKAKDLIVLRGLRVDFFDEQGARSSQLLANEGEILQSRRDMTARGKVVLATSEGTRMTSEELRYLNAENLIRSNVRVRVERQGDVLEGVGFQSDPNLHNFEFKTRVQATVQGRSGAVFEQRSPR